MTGAVERDWRDTFCGRVEPLASLEQAYREVLEGLGPRCVVVLGDRGMGKTRLVQEFYRVLTTDYDPDDYWPDAALFRGNNLKVAPDPRAQHFQAAKLGERRLPFLWWGLRLSDPEERNAAPPGLRQHRDALDPHLADLFYARQAKALDQARLNNLKETGKGAALKPLEFILAAVPFLATVVSTIIELIDKLQTDVGHRRDKARLAAEQAEARVAALAKRQADDLIEATLDDLTALLGAQPDLAAVPLVLFVDDAQFARPGGDEGTLRLLRDLWPRARSNRWPLLLVASHWALEWEQDRAGPPETFAGAFSRLMGTTNPDWCPLVLDKEDALDDLVAAGLPDLPTMDRRRLLDKADGNPQLLLELIDLVRRSGAWRTPNGALTEAARGEIASGELDLHRLIVRRLEGDATPAAVRTATALSSMQGIELLCALTEAAGEALGLGALAPGLDQARQPHRYITDAAGGVAAFVQRAYYDAARSIVPRHLGDPDAVKAALLSAAAGLLDDPERAGALSPEEHRAALGIRAGLGEDALDPDDRRKAAEALLTLIQAIQGRHQARDYAQAAQLAVRFAQGIEEGRWEAKTFSLVALDAAREAIQR